MTIDDVANLNALVEQKAIMKMLVFVIMCSISLTNFLGTTKM